MPLNRRAFLRKATATAAAFGAARLAPADSLPTVPGHAGLVHLLIETDRDRLPERLVEHIRNGLGFPTLLGAIAEASVRQIRPYPHVGFKYHAFMVLQAVHRCTLLGRPQDGWLPVLWAMDVFKGSQAAERRLGNWTLGAVPEHRVPATHRAEGAFRDAMERWDAEAADAALIGLARSVPRDWLFALLFRYGARDFRAIEHKAITVANCHRLLGVVAAEHTEPMLRSLVLALLNHEGEPNPADNDLAPDRPWRRNRLLANQTKANKEPGREGGRVPVAEILEVLRDGSDEGAGRAMLEGLELLDQGQDSGSALEDIFATVSVDRVEAARKTLGYLGAGGAELPFMNLARQYVVDRTTGYHDYKFAEAAFENAAAMESPWRKRYLAASVLYLNGSADKPNETVARARSLFG